LGLSVQPFIIKDISFDKTQSYSSEQPGIKMGERIILVS
jgi:hypothetical protein